MALRELDILRGFSSRFLQWRHFFRILVSYTVFQATSENGSTLSEKNLLPEGYTILTALSPLNPESVPMSLKNRVFVVQQGGKSLYSICYFSRFSFC